MPFRRHCRHAILPKCRRCKPSCQWRHGSTSAVITEAACQIASTQSTPAESTSDLPGFYFDPELKRYFKLLPGTNNHNPLTTRLVRAKQNQERWNSTNGVEQTSSSLVPSHLPYLLSLHQLGLTGHDEMMSSVLKNQMAHLACTRSCVVDGPEGYPTDECRYFIGRPEQDAVVGAWSLAGDSGVVVQALQPDPRCTGTDGIASGRPFEFGGVINVHRGRRAVDMCWAADGSGSNFLLYVTESCDARIPLSSSVHLLPCRKFCSFSTPEHRFRVDSMSRTFERDDTAIWSCAWNERTCSIAFAAEGRSYLANTETADFGTVFTGKENAYSLCFGSGGALLYSGTHRGNVICTDLRDRPCDQYAYAFPVGRGVSNIKLLSDDVTMIASAYDDKLLRVDLRSQKSVLQYPEHSNEHMKIPFSVDETAGIVCSSGQDKAVRMWTLHSGCLLTTIPPPAIRDEMASVRDSPATYACYSESWGSGPTKRRPLLIVALEKNLSMFTLSD